MNTQSISYIPDGIYDNQGMKQREYWKKGKCIQRVAVEQLNTPDFVAVRFGFYPDLPTAPEWTCPDCCKRPCECKIYPSLDGREEITMNALLGILGDCSIKNGGLITWETGVRAIREKCNIFWKNK